MSDRAIEQVLEALRARLQAALGRSRATATVHVGPPDDSEAQSSDLSILLVRAAATPTLRNDKRHLPPTQEGQPPRVLPGAVPLDLTVLLTTASKETGGERDALGRLGRVIQTLALTPMIGPPEVPDQEARITLEPATTEELTRIWAMFPQSSYRPSLIYLVTPVWIDPPDQSEPPMPVLSDRRLVGQFAS
ncbi:Pvc16 family protein [Siccirubricoccus sp. G192]|uniref:Pvc16 family protein n=1 Tax=Siccirubricoccus sp. G192 TaxID=2849651 RepID=UPI001C2C749C|nr:Pvc16 family protein [Siccirubricoccus sp. G192]MBV1800612.1 DUF4255 domain-containing protein [Siccirubricoccus sp. G192]MBV1800676.1 DUF4255 domain-containing protein [Siccirubricoccus sp. G192]